MVWQPRRFAGLALAVSLLLVMAACFACSGDTTTTTSAAPATTTPSGTPGGGTDTTGGPTTTAAGSSTTATTAAGGPSVTIPPLSTAYTVLILGSDTRSGNVMHWGASDVNMLLRVDPEKDFVSLLSIPRDLWVEVPGHGSQRINTAYAFGGPALAKATIKHVFGITVDKYIAITFGGFEKIIDSLGGFYFDVDRTYTNAKFRPLELSPGYQLLDGKTTLVYARYRFDSNVDIGRMHRQQWILASIREQARTWDLGAKLPGLFEQALKAADTDMTPLELLTTVGWLVGVDGTRMKQSYVKAKSATEGTRSVLKASAASIAQASKDLLAPPKDAADDTAATGAGGETASTAPPSGGTPLDLAMWKAWQASVPFALEAPAYMPTGFKYAYRSPAGSGTYGIKVGDGTKPAICAAYQWKGGNLYMRVNATTWLDAPLAAKGVEMQANGVTYTIVGTAVKVHHIWWKKDGVLYFISNTLMFNVSREDMIKIALSMVPVG